MVWIWVSIQFDFCTAILLEKKKKKTSRFTVGKILNGLANIHLQIARSARNQEMNRLLKGVMAFLMEQGSSPLLVFLLGKGRKMIEDPGCLSLS